MEFWQSTPFVIIYIVAAGILAFLSFISLKLKHSRTTNTFRAVMLSAFIWVVGYILQISGTNLEFKLIILRIEYAGIISSVFFWFLFVINYTNYRQLIDKWVIGTLAIIPVLTYLEVLTLTLHDFFYASYQLEDFNGMLLLTKEYGMGFYIWTGYAYLITTASLLIVFFRAFSLPRKYRNQILPLAISVFLIILPNILYVFNINPIYPFDFTNLFIALVGLIMLISMHLSKFLNMIPVAYNMVVKDAQMGIIIINEYHEILDINNTALKILNQKNYNVIGKTVTDIFPEYQPYLDQNRKEDEFKDELVLGDNLTFEMKVTPFLNQGSESGKIIGLWEITELKSLLKDLDAYAHTVAHDLKASVSQVISLSELINTTEMTENERTQMINYIGQAGRNMNSIIEELLKLARTRNLEEEKHEKLDVSEVVSIVLSRIKLEKYGDANIKLPEPDKWPVLAVNSVWFEEIWYNLITNAYKYGNGVIEIGWTKEKSDLVFWVKDNGDGLSESEQIEIFEAQPKNEEEVKDTKSHGLGLSIVKRIVSKMGGKVWVKSKPGKGSTFYFSLPEN